MPGSATRERAKARELLAAALAELRKLDIHINASGMDVEYIKASLKAIEIEVAMAQVHATLAVSAEYPSG